MTLNKANTKRTNAPTFKCISYFESMLNDLLSLKQSLHDENQLDMAMGLQTKP